MREDNHARYDYLSPRAHDKAAFGAEIPGEDYEEYAIADAQYKSIIEEAGRSSCTPVEGLGRDSCAVCGDIDQPEYWHATAEHDQAANESALFLPGTEALIAIAIEEKGEDFVSLPAIRLAGIVVFVYQKEGKLRVSIDADDWDAQDTTLAPYTSGEETLFPVQVCIGDTVIYNADEYGEIYGPVGRGEMDEADKEAALNKKEALAIRKREENE